MSRLATTVVGLAASVWLATDGRAGAIVIKVYVDPGSPAAFERLVSHVRALPGHEVVRSLPHQGVLWFTAREGARPDADQVRAEAENLGFRVLTVEVEERRPEEGHRGCQGH